MIMGQIIMTIRAINWIGGNCGCLGVYLNKGSCKIDWGDGCMSTILARTENEFTGASHLYARPSKKAGSQFDIIITSNSNNNVVGLIAGSGEMNVDNVDISGCQTLKYFSADWLISRFDLKTNPGIEKIHLSGACEIADFSGSTELRELKFTCNYKVSTLDLSKCDQLEYLDCSTAQDLTDIKIGNRCALKKIIYNDCTPLNYRTLEILNRIVVDKNGGEIIKDSLLGEE